MKRINYYIINLKQNIDKFYKTKKDLLNIGVNPNRIHRFDAYFGTTDREKIENNCWSCKFTPDGGNGMRL